MAEPEDVLAEGALLVTNRARALWARHVAGSPEPAPGLRELKRRLELFVAAVFPDAPTIGVADPPAPPSFLWRMAHRRTAHLRSSEAVATVQGGQIRLPGRLDTLPVLKIPERYRLLVLEQAARVHRGTFEQIPADNPLLRDLYLLAEAAATDALLVRMVPRLASSLREARQEAAAKRERPRVQSEQEQAVEHLIGVLLAAEPGIVPSPFTDVGTPDTSLRWAASAQNTIATSAGPYRGMVLVALWGAVPDAPETAPSWLPDVGDEPAHTPGRSRTLPRRPKSRDAAADEDDEQPGTWIIRADDVQEKAEDPAGLQRPADRDQDADTGDLADALSELPEARLVRRPERVSEVLAGENPVPRATAGAGNIPEGGLLYPEWDWRTGTYRVRACAVREQLAAEGSDAWVRDTLRRHAPMLRVVRRDFERLRPRRMAIRRQADGADLDLDALVAAYADRLGGSIVDDRLYIDTRPVRRDAAIALLVDASASTDSWVAGVRRIIDVEKEALLIVCEALASLGDPHTVLAFASNGPSKVSIQVLRRFDEPASAGAVQRRIAGLEPDGFTRAGAALRHVTAGLARQPARHRLLLLLSDGRPNDVDAYEGRYGIEDTRMAVAEARMQGVHVFCLTVDREAPKYATRIFGRDFTVLSRAEHLPSVLTGLLRNLVRG